MCFCVEFCGRHEKFCEKKNIEPNGRTFDQKINHKLYSLCVTCSCLLNWDVKGSK